MSQRTLVLIKPDAVRRGLTGAILSRYEAKGLTVVAARSAATGPYSAAGAPVTSAQYRSP